MKYEIIKGSEKDFEVAPDWATMKCHCTVGDPSKITNMNVAFSDGVVRGSRWVAAFEDDLEGVIDREEQWHIIAERRPITEPVWSGEGVPCVGQKVMTKSGEGIIDYVGSGVIVYSNNDGQWSVRCDSLDYSLSAIRSPEDVARNEAKGIIAELCRSSASNGHSADLIYDAIAAGSIKGITKTPTVSELMRVTENATREDCEAIVKMLSCN